MVNNNSVISATEIESKSLTYKVITYGCQMNTHDSERIAGLLQTAGYKPIKDDSVDPDILIFNTCAVRENAANRLYGNLSHLVEKKALNPNMQVAVGGCLAQKDKDEIIKRSPVVDVVFGTHNIAALPVLLDRSRRNKRAEFEILDSLSGFSSSLPAKREQTYAGWVSISVGCNNTCTFCIVPQLRGKALDRRPGEILEEIKVLVDEGVSEIILLGQNVNAYGSSFVDPAESRDRGAFAKLLRACGDISGLRRVKFTSPHPADFTDDVIAAMAETDNVCPQLHMPLQSGSDRVLKAMRRSYRRKKFSQILNKVRAAIPEAAVTTDIIVGFPGETEEDFLQTLEVVEESRFMNAYTFQYSPRPGTPAASMDNQIPKEIVQDRFDRLLEVQEKIAEEESHKQIGKIVELLVTNEGRKNNLTSRMSGRANDGRVVHFDPASLASSIRPGDYILTKVTSAAPHHLLADAGVISHEPTKAGDLYTAGKEMITQGRPISLGLPKIGEGIAVISSSDSSRSNCSGEF